MVVFQGPYHYAIPGATGPSKGMFSSLGVSAFTALNNTAMIYTVYLPHNLIFTVQTINGEMFRIESMSHLTVFQFVIRVFMALSDTDTDTEALRSIMALGLKSPADRPRGCQQAR